jgi:O-antigen/teichoic acid export membrane protein
MVASDNARIAKNTAMLYFRMLVIMCVTLYTSRVVLNTLGIEDFGIYNVVGGIVVMFTFLNSAMVASTSRFLIFELGKRDYNQLKKVFSASLCSHVAISFIIFLLAETIGLWFLAHKLVIPEDRMSAAHWVYQFSIFSSLVSLTQVPYNAVIIAHERMNVYAYVTIVEGVLKLIIVYLLIIGGFDKLKTYAILVFVVALIIAMIYRLYCRKNFEECEFSLHRDKALYKELFSFSVWDAYGGFAIMGMGQGLNMLLNMFFGPTVNAARGLAYQMQGAISGFGNNFMVAVKPRIIKLYAENNVTQMMELVFGSSKYSFFLVYIFSLPLLLETSFILELWLKIVPAHAVSFCRLVLINELIWSMRSPIVTSFHAVGQIKVANLVCGSLFYLVVIVSYFCLKKGLSPESVFIVTIVVSLIVQITELFLLKRLILFSVRVYVKQVVWLCLLVMVVSAIFPYLLRTMLPPGFIRLFVVGLTCVITVATSVYYIGIDKETRDIVVKQLKLRFGNHRICI